MTTRSQSSSSALVAASRVLTGERIDDPKRQRESWQNEAWAFYDEQGPLRFGANWLANLISRARLYAGRMEEGGDEPEPVESGPPMDAVVNLAGGIGGQSQMLRSLVVHLTVPGLSYLVGTENLSEWRIYSSDTIRLKRQVTPTITPIYEVQIEREKWIPLDDPLVVKIWRPHERYQWEADSPARAALGALRELRRIDQYVDAVLVSRLSGAGLLAIPSEVTYPTAPTQADPAKDPFISEVMEVMLTAVKKPGTAAAIVPIPIKVPGDYVDKIKHITFATELSERILELRESALRRLSIALDMPAEVLTGMGDLTHWNAWQVEETAIKVHAEPLLEVITNALTEGYLHPVLQTLGVDDFEEYVIWADTSELTVRPDRSDDAFQLYDRGELNADALRRETGMGEADSPTDDQLADWAYKKILANPQLATLALEGLGVPVPQVETVTTTSPPASGAPVEMNGAEPDEESQGPPEEPPEEDVGAEVTAALVLESYVVRALERAGNRIRSANRGVAVLNDCPPEQAHCCLGGVDDASALLASAWDRVPYVAERLGIDAALLVQELNQYCVTLLERGFAYDYDTLVRIIGPLTRQVTTTR